MARRVVNQVSISVIGASCLLLTGCFAEFATTKPKTDTRPVKWPTESDFSGVLFVLSSDHVTSIGETMASIYPQAFVSINKDEKDLILHAGKIKAGTRPYAKIHGSPIIWIDPDQRPKMRRNPIGALAFLNLGLVFPLPIPRKNIRDLTATTDSKNRTIIPATHNSTVYYGLIWAPITMFFIRDSLSVVHPVKIKSRPEEWIEYFPPLLSQTPILEMASSVTTEGYQQRQGWFKSLEPSCVVSKKAE